MKYIALTPSIYKFIFFFVISSFGLTAQGYQQCQDIIIYSSGACPGGVAACTEGRQTTQKVCYEVPDGSGPIPGGAGTGTGPSTGGGGDRPEPPKRPKPAYCNTIDIDFSQCRQDAQTTYSRDSSSCPMWAYGGGALGLGVAVAGAYFTGGASLIAYLGAGAAGGATGVGTGAVGTSLCDSDKAKVRDDAFTRCDTNKERVKLDCSTY